LQFVFTADPQTSRVESAGAADPDDSTMTISAVCRIRASTDLPALARERAHLVEGHGELRRPAARGGRGVASTSMDALVVPSEAWVAAWTSQCNQNAEYLSAARGWDGVVALRINPDGDHLQRPYYVQLTARDGQWASHLGGADPALAEHPSFLLTAPYRTWKQLIRQEIDPVRAIMGGTVRVQGRLSELLRWSGSLRVMTELAGRVDTEFGDEVRHA